MRFRQVPDSALSVACQLFLEGKRTVDIRDAVNAELEQCGSDYRILREKVYPLIALASERRFFHFSPPRDLALTQRICDIYDVTRERIHVSGGRALEQVAATAADVVVGLIEDLAQKKPNVHVALGAGWTSMLVANHMATRLRGMDDLPKLTFHALSSGFHALNPRTAPVSFFGFFEGIDTEIDYVGLFAAPWVNWGEFDDAMEKDGVVQAVEEKGEIDIVVTSLGSASHDHSDFNYFMEDSPDGLDVLRREAWVGDVQYRPFSVSGPIEADTVIRAITLLELQELVAMAATPDKYVVAVSGLCRECDSTRIEAVRPLFVEESLKLWTHFVMDLSTASELVRKPEPGEPDEA